MRLGLVGLGRWGQRVAATAQRLPGITLAGVVTSRPGEASRAAPGTEAFATLESMLRSAALDGVMLAVPADVQPDLAAACLSARVPVLVEKPLATTVAHAAGIAELAGSTATLVVVDHTHVFSAAFQKLQTLVGEGPLTVRSVAGNWGPFRSSVDALWDYGPHDVAMALELVGAPVEACSVTRHERSHPGGLLVQFTLAFAGGHHADITVANTMRPKRRYLQVADGRGVLEYDDLAPAKLTRTAGSRREEVAIDDELPLDRVIRSFAAAIEDGAATHPSLALGVDVVRVLAGVDAALDGAGPG